MKRISTFKLNAQFKKLIWIFQPYWNTLRTLYNRKITSESNTLLQNMWWSWTTVWCVRKISYQAEMQQISQDVQWYGRVSTSGSWTVVFHYTLQNIFFSNNLIQFVFLIELCIIQGLDGLVWIGKRFCSAKFNERIKFKKSVCKLMGEKNIIWNKIGLYKIMFLNKKKFLV